MAGIGAPRDARCWLAVEIQFSIAPRSA